LTTFSTVIFNDIIIANVLTMTQLYF